MASHLTISQILNDLAKSRRNTPMARHHLTDKSRANIQLFSKISLSNTQYGNGFLYRLHEQSSFNHPDKLALANANSNSICQFTFAK